MRIQDFKIFHFVKTSQEFKKQTRKQNTNCLKNKNFCGDFFFSVLKKDAIIKALGILDDNYLVSELKSLKNKQFQKACEYIKSGIGGYSAISASLLEDEEREKFETFLKENMPPNQALNLASLNNNALKRARLLFDYQIDTQEAKTIALGDLSTYKKALEMTDLNTQPDSIVYISCTNNDEYKEIKNLVKKGVSGFDAYEIACFEDVKQKYNDLINKGYDIKTSSIMANVENSDLTNEKYLYKIINKLNRFDNRKEHISKTLSWFMSDCFSVNLEEFTNYIEKIDFDDLEKRVPENFSFESALIFSIYNFFKGKTSFCDNDLIFKEDMTSFLKNNYLSAQSLSDLLSVFPKTKREVGNLPKGWENADFKKVCDCIDEFRLKRDIKKFERNLSSVLKKDVKVQRLSFGNYGIGYKISSNGVEDVCLKLFYSKQYKKETKLNGQYIEPQTALFVNNHSNDFVKMYFGRIAGKNNNDGFLITQYLKNDTIPLETNPDDCDKYIIDSADISQYNNTSCGKIYDFGMVYIKSKDKSSVEWDLFDELFNTNKVF